ncbi:MAG: DUF4396 domain-containing protein, partial [Actinomycetes bacterium]
MDMTTMESTLPGWLTPVAWTFLALAVASAAAIAYDIYARHHRHTHLAAELVWVGSALYLGPFALGLYARQGRTAPAERAADGREQDSGRHPSAADALPGGTASAIAHVIGVPLVIASGLTIAGLDLWVMILVIAVVAMVLLFSYERAISTTRGAGIPVGAALAAAALTVLAFDIGMGGWMLLLH